MTTGAHTPVELPTVGTGPIQLPPTSNSEKLIPISRVHVPITAWIAALVVVLGGVVSMTVVWARTAEHGSAAQLHVDPRAREAGGGVAYKNEVNAVRRDFREAIRDSQQRMRTVIKGMVISCRRTQGDMVCRVTELPDFPAEVH